MNPHNPLAAPESEELSWQAFLYVSEELSPDEVVDFEERLLTDQSAREAVAEAAKMAEGLWMATAMDSFNRPATPAQTADSRTGRSGKLGVRRRWAMWMGSTIVAAGLAFCVGWWFGNPSSVSPTGSQAKSPVQEIPQDESARAPESDGTGELVELWTDSQSLVAELDFGPSVEYPTELAEESESQDHPNVDDQEFAWMLVALSPDSPAGPPSESEVMEN